MCGRTEGKGPLRFECEAVKTAHDGLKSKTRFFVEAGYKVKNERTPGDR